MWYTWIKILPSPLTFKTNSQWARSQNYKGTVLNILRGVEEPLKHICGSALYTIKHHVTVRSLCNTCIITIRCYYGGNAIAWPRSSEILPWRFPLPNRQHFHSVTKISSDSHSTLKDPVSQRRRTPVLGMLPQHPRICQILPLSNTDSIICLRCNCLLGMQ